MTILRAYTMRHGKERCGTWFQPREVHRLHVDPTESHRYLYQDLCKGTCPDCGAEVYSWYGVDDLGDYGPHENISADKHLDWEMRLVTDYKRRIMGDKDKKKADKVTGSERVFPWRFLQSIPVY